MRSRSWKSSVVLLSVVVAVVACGKDESKSETKPACTLGTTTGCENNKVCEEVSGGTPTCFDPIRIEGTVSNALSGAAIAGALVVACDANGAAVSGTATSDAAGKYSLAVPVRRDAQGNPSNPDAYTLRADASQYQTFPTAPRVALPIKLEQPTAGVVTSAATNIALIPLPTGTACGTITGKVVTDKPKGTLVVAGSATALVASDGSFTIFNVAPGTATVTGYRQGVNLTPASVTVVANDTIKDVTLTASANPTVAVSGKVEIVNPGAGTATSVILVVEDTYVENAARGEAPPGLRMANVSGAFAISGVPDGKYVVLAAFENDFLVRDPDTSIGGTATVHVTVAGQDVALSEGFKITGALDVVSPTDEQVVTGTPTFVWADDSSEDVYSLVVYDALGNLTWENTQVPSVSGSKDVSVPYAGPALTPGMVYQFRATSMKKGVPISRTEDLKGVFRIQ